MLGKNYIKNTKVKDKKLNKFKLDAIIIFSENLLVRFNKLQVKHLIFSNNRILNTISFKSFIQNCWVSKKINL